VMAKGRRMVRRHWRWTTYVTPKKRAIIAGAWAGA